METTSEEKKIVRFSRESLSLLCEWESCSVTEEDIESFISHINKEHLTKLNESDLSCHWKACEGFTENLPELRRHVLLHAFHTKIKCHGSNLQFRKKLPECSLGYQNRNVIPELPEPLVCCWENCSEEFECPEYFYRHADYHAECESERENKSSAICLWQDCHRIFTDQHKVKEHLRSHTQEKLIACPVCGGMFASRTKFFDHIQRQLAIADDDPEGAYICEYCGRKMSSDRLLRDHMRHHVNHYKCPYCDMTCPTPSGVQVHISYRHSNNKLYACHYCEHRCKSENDLRKHLETHSVDPPYKCPVENCSYATRSQTCFTAHYRNEHEKKRAKYSCHLCEKIFTRGNYLTKHLLNHHKFQWPSGHCKFRYRLHMDGHYRLQTVRYESLELSQTMMYDNVEDIDDPDNVMRTLSQNNSEENKFCLNEPHIISNRLLQSTNQSVSAGSVVFCLEDGNKVKFPQNIPMINAQLCNTTVQESSSVEEEPVLINIIDAADATDSTGSALLFVQNPTQKESERQQSVQIVMKDSAGALMFETAQVIGEYEPL